MRGVVIANGDATNGTSRLDSAKEDCGSKRAGAGWRAIWNLVVWESVTLLSSAMDHVGFGYGLAKEGLGSKER